MTKQNPNVRTAFDYFSSRGYSQAQAAGIIGNLLGESNLNPNGPNGDGGVAKGIAQWHPDRWGVHVSRAKQMGRDPRDLHAQLDFVDWELRNREKSAFNSLMQAKTVDEATAAFIGFERPAGWTKANPRAGHNYSGRLRYASDVYGLMSGVTPPEPSRLTFSTPDGGQPYSLSQPENTVSVMDSTQPMVPDTLAMERQAAQAREDAAQDTSMWQGVQDAINTDWSMSALWRDNGAAPPDRNFRLDKPLMDELTKGIPEQYWDRFGDAQSLPHAEGMRKSLMKQLEAEDRLAGMGTGGIALRIAAGVTDPLAWAAAAGVSVASMGVGAPAAIGARFGKIGMIGLTAAEAGAGVAISEGVLQATKPTADISDLYWGVGTGMVLGGAFGAIARNPATAAEAQRLQQIGRDLQKSTSLTPGGSTAGAAQVNPREALRVDTADIVRDAERPSVMKAPRYDSAYALKSSDNDLTAMIGNVLVEDGARNTKGITPIGASEVQQRLQLQADAKWSRSSKANFADYQKRNPEATRQDFAQEVTKFTRNRDVLVEFDPAVKSQGQMMREILGDFAELGANPGLIDGRTMRSVAGFEGLTRNDFYVPRIFDLGSIQDHLTKFGHRTLSGLVARGIREVNDEITEELAEKFAYNYVKKIHSLSAGELQMASRAFSGEDIAGLKANLMDGTDLSAEEIEQIVAHMKPGPKDGASRHGKSRAFYDENFGMMLPLSNGQPGSQFVRISDLFLNDSDRLMQSYTRQMSGRIAMARLEIRNPKWQPGDAAEEFFVKGVTSDGEWTKLMEQVRDVGDQKGIQGATKKDIERLNWAYDSIVGRPKWNEGSDWNQFLRMVRDYNFIRVMGQVGFAQLSETMNTVAQLGLKASFSNMPSLRSLWRNAKTGKLDDALAQEIEDITALGTDWVRHDTHRRYDLFDNPLDTWSSERVQRIDDALQKGKRAVSAMSGMAPVNTVLQRWTGRSIFNKFAMMAQGRTKMNPRRLEALGLDAERVEAIFENIRTHATFDGKRLKAMNFDKWTDRDAVASFEAAAFRLGRSIIQENDIGQMAMWMSAPLARTFIQFRSFMLASYTKQTLQGLNFRDTTTAMAFMGTTFAASLSYMARTHLNALGRSDREEYLEKRLSLDRIAAAGIQNSSWASLMPMMVDSGLGIAGRDSFFDARNTGLASNLWLGNPTSDLADAIPQATGVFGKALRGGQVSQSDIRTLARILPFQNMNGVAQFLSVMVRPLPEWSRDPR